MTAPCRLNPASPCAGTGSLEIAACKRCSKNVAQNKWRALRRAAMVREEC